MNEPAAKWPKNSMYQCPSCVRHYLGGGSAERYDASCNVCGTAIDPKADRIK